MISQRNLFFNHIAQTSPEPLALEIDSAIGVYLTDIHGKQYIDLISGISVSNIGHRHPNVVKAIRLQTDKYLHLMVYGEYIQSPQVLLAQKITSLLPSHLSNVFFVNSGSEANDGALKLSRKFTGRSEILSCVNAYHGSTFGALSAMGSEDYKQWFAPLIPGFSNITFGNIDDLQKISVKTAAILIEPIQGEAGVRVANGVYWKALQQKCKDTGTLIIADEVQTGFGRTGKMFGFDYAGFTPDIVTFAKGMGGGMPIGAFVASKEMMESFTHHPILGHITTFGGHPVSCAAALACIETIENENLINRVPEISSFIVDELSDINGVREIRAAGLLIAIEFDSFEINKKIIDTCIQNGVIADWFLFCDNSMRIAPPINITNLELKKAIEIIKNSIEKNI
jgi:acetylornithine/succinyldiaminopimelate/putrescine aminotransferase